MSDDMKNKYYFKKAANAAKKSTCKRAKCGAVIVSLDGIVIGEGFNAPPLGDESQRMCDFVCDKNKKPKYDKTCCVHAEWNAIIDAVMKYPEKIVGSTLYFMRIDDNGCFTDAGDPFCTVCSRLALQSGIDYFALWDESKPRIFDTRDYNKKTYEYYE